MTTLTVAQLAAMRQAAARRWPAVWWRKSQINAVWQALADAQAAGKPLEPAIEAAAPGLFLPDQYADLIDSWREGM